MRKSVALALCSSGVVLYRVVIHVGGYLAAIAVPTGYFAWFGANKTLALTLQHALTFALPIFVLAVTWSFLSIRPVRTRHRRATLCCLAGVVAGWFGWAIAGLVQFAAHPSAQPLPWTTLAVAILVPPIWGRARRARRTGRRALRWLACRPAARVARA